MRADSVATVSLVENRHAGLHDDRAGIELAGDEVHGRSGDLHAVPERLLLGIDAGERRQQRRMDVEHGVRKRVEQPRADQTHETGEADEADAALAQFLRQPRVEIVARGELAMADDERFDARVAGEVEPTGVGAVRDDDRDARVELAARDRGDQRLKIAAAAGDEHAEAALLGWRRLRVIGS